MKEKKINLQLTRVEAEELEVILWNYNNKYSKGGQILARLEDLIQEQKEQETSRKC